ncbi:HD domain-containing protein [Candidatus Peregrinibacteria bacterium]|nr:HD domain-containing protein [Candidatus Peregrinibacteria bacterium]
MNYFAPLAAKLKKRKDLDFDLIQEAYIFAHDAHEGQKRASGEDYIIHPVAVAGLICDIGGDKESVMAALLHDVIEDTSINRKTLKDTFGLDIGVLVEGVTKFDKDVKKNLKVSVKDQSLKKFFSSVTSDPRIIFIKFADRLHNMQTISFLKQNSQMNIAKETQDFYVPLASAVNAWSFKKELENLSCKVLNPNEYYHFEHCLEDSKSSENNITEELSSILLRQDKIIKNCKSKFIIEDFLPYELKKYSQKFKLKNRHFYRIIFSVDEAMTCYLLLGLLHDFFPPMQGEIKDYIAKPKVNEYQAIHTQVIYQGKQLECIIQLNQKTSSLKHEIEERQEKKFSSSIGHILQYKLLDLVKKTENSSL